MVMLSFSNWWSAMEMLEKVYWGIALPASLIFVILIIATIFVGDVDDFDGGDVDAAVDGDDGVGFHFVTLKNMIAFFTLAGWSGIASIHAGHNTTTSIIISFVCGLIMMSIMALLYYLMGKMTSSGTLNMKNAINRTGEAYLLIPAKRGGIGKVQVKVQGSLRTLDAITDEEEEIKTGTVIEVIDVTGTDILIVKKSK
jgi:membrane protein implicated in regulation of membrane protease activity